MASDETALLRESIATLEQQLDHAKGRAQILAAQLGGWEAACAAQILAARGYLKAMRHTGHNGYQTAARTQLEESIDSNAGEILLGQLEACQQIVEWYADPSNYDSFSAPGTTDPQAGTWHTDAGERARAALKARET